MGEVVYPEVPQWVMSERADKLVRLMEAIAKEIHPSDKREDYETDKPCDTE